MKHKWELLTPGSGPLVATSLNLGAPMRYKTGWRLCCTKCGEDLTIPYDELDSENIADFIVEQKARNDCPGKKT